MLPANLLGLPAPAAGAVLILFGILVILVPSLLPWLVGILLIVAGVALIAGQGTFDRPALRSRSSPPPRRL